MFYDYEKCAAKNYFIIIFLDFKENKISSNIL